MKPQAAGLVLSALLISTFGHDVNRHQAAHSSAKSRQARLHTRNHETVPSQSTQISGNSSDNVIIINAEDNLVAVVNETATFAVVFDFSHCYVAIYCGDTGNVYVINLETKVGIFIPGNSSHRGWIAQSESFEAYFKSLNSLESVYRTCESSGEKFQIGNVSPKISRGIKLATLALNRGELFVTQADALEYLITYSKIYVETFRGPLNGFLRILGNDSSTLKISVRSLIVIGHTLGEVVSKIKGGIKVLADLQFDWLKFYNSRSWLQSFISLFSKLAEHNVDVKSIIADYEDNISVLLAGLAGNSTEGTNRVIRIFADVKGIILGKCTADSLVHTILLDYFSRAKDNCATFDDFKKELKEVEAFIFKLGVETELAIPVAYINGVMKGHFVERGIDLYKITEICFDRTEIPLHNVIRILSQIQKDVSLESSVSYLLYRLIGLIVDRSVDVIRSLLPGVNIDCSEDILTYIFRDAKESDLRDNLYEFLHCRPVIGQILQIIESSLEHSGNMSLRELIASQNFRKYRCVITKTLTKVIKSVEEGHGGGDVTRQLKSPHYGTSGKHLVVKGKEHKDKHKTYAASQSGKKEQHHDGHAKQKSGHDKQHKQ